MLSRYIAKPSHLRLLALITSQSHISNHKHPLPLPLSLRPSIPVPNSFNSFPTIPRYFSSNRDNNKNGNNQSGFWNISAENDQDVDSVFGEDTGSLEGMVADASARPKEDPWVIDLKGKGFGKRDASSVSNGDDIFKGIEDGKEIGTSGGIDGWETGEGYTDWNLTVEEGREEEVFDTGDGEQHQEMRGFDSESLKSGEGYTDWNLTVEEGREEEVFDIGDGEQQQEMRCFDEAETLESLKSEEEKRLTLEEQELSAVLKGPDRAFGDLIAASGITDAMLDSLIALKDLDGIEGLPPLQEIEDMRYEKATRKSSRAEIERLKQEEVSKARVRQVDSKGRAYGTGKRKCSIARVWIQPGEGKFKVNDKQFDVYFPMLDHRAALLRPFSETKTLGLMDVNCSVKGGGVSGQVGAIRLGISRALQNWAPDQRPPLKAAGFLTRDSRIVERKKPGKAKARKSYQWVKR